MMSKIEPFKSSGGTVPLFLVKIWWKNRWWILDHSRVRTLWTGTLWISVQVITKWLNSLYPLIFNSSDKLSKISNASSVMEQLSSKSCPVISGPNGYNDVGDRVHIGYRYLQLFTDIKCLQHRCSRPDGDQSWPSFSSQNFLAWWNRNVVGDKSVFPFLILHQAKACSLRSAAISDATKNLSLK